jgi:hypothetical protein
MSERKQKQLKIAEILFDLGLDVDIIETITKVSKEEMKNIH